MAITCPCGEQTVQLNDGLYRCMNPGCELGQAGAIHISLDDQRHPLVSHEEVEREDRVRVSLHDPRREERGL